MTEDKYKKAYMTWSDKTDWMQEKGTIPAKYLGMHRADILKAMLDEAYLEIKELKEEIRIANLSDLEWYKELDE